MKNSPKLLCAVRLGPVDKANMVAAGITNLSKFVREAIQEKADKTAPISNEVLDD